MTHDTKKTLAQINAEVHSGKSVVADVEPAKLSKPAGPDEKKVDIVTTATQKNNVYMPPFPVMMPPPLPKKDKDPK